MDNGAIEKENKICEILGILESLDVDDVISITIEHSDNAERTQFLGDDKEKILQSPTMAIVTINLRYRLGKEYWENKLSNLIRIRDDSKIVMKELDEQIGLLTKKTMEE